MYRLNMLRMSDVAKDGRVLIAPKREAYMYPTTDESKEPFHWGFPKLSALRAFLHEELSWSISKVDDELTPIVQRIARRGKVSDERMRRVASPSNEARIPTSVLHSRMNGRR
jgi:hypothetical protein